VGCAHEPAGRSRIATRAGRLLLGEIHGPERARPQLADDPVAALDARPIGARSAGSTNGTVVGPVRLSLVSLLTENLADRLHDPIDLGDFCGPAARADVC